MSDANKFDFRQFADKYAEEEAANLGPTELYCRLKKGGVSKMNIFLLLQERFSINLPEFTRLAGEIDGVEDEPG